MHQLEQALESPHYGQVLRDALAVQALAHCERGPGACAAIQRLQQVLAHARSHPPLELAASACALAIAGIPVRWGPVVRQLLDAQADDGSVESCFAP